MYDRRLFLIPVFCSLVLAIACSDDSTPAEPGFVLTSQSQLEGLWRGGITNGVFLIDSIGDYPQDKIFEDMKCTLMMGETTYNLTMLNDFTNTQTTYCQIGTWSWNENDPARIQFVCDSLNIEQNYLSLRNGLSGTGRIDTTNFSWSCRVEVLSEDYQSINLTGFQCEHGFGEWPDTAVVLFARP